MLRLEAAEVQTVPAQGDVRLPGFPLEISVVVWAGRPVRDNAPCRSYLSKIPGCLLVACRARQIARESARQTPADDILHNAQHR